jgi:hypothetical protein
MKFDIKLKVAIPLFVALGLISVANAGTFEDVQAAFAHGDYATALYFVRPLAEQGDARAEAGLGTMYATGRGVTQDNAEAVKWYRLAADQGLAVAQNNLGDMYQNGHGVPKDEDQALQWYRLAANQGYRTAQANIDRIERERQSGIAVAIEVGSVIVFVIVGAILLCYFAIRYVEDAIRYVENFVWQSCALIRHGTALQRGLARFWIMVSAGWLVHSIWWIASHCEGVSGRGYYCTSGTFRIEHGSLSTVDVWGYVLTTPIAMLFIVIAAYWIIRGFQPGWWSTTDMSPTRELRLPAPVSMDSTVDPGHGSKGQRADASLSDILRDL